MTNLLKSPLTGIHILAGTIMLLMISGCDGQGDQETGNSDSPPATEAAVTDNNEEPSAAKITEPATAAASPDERVSAPAEDKTQLVTDTTPSASSEETINTASAESEPGKLYNVVDGHKLDAFSYKGFKLYRNWCARCHGTYGQGMVGPNLAESLNVIDKDEFVDVVTHGKTGQIGNMPAWESNPSVIDGMDNLYAYLKARADGAIGEVKPRKQ